MYVCALSCAQALSSMSETMSSPSDWSQFYNQQNNNFSGTMFGEGVSDATVVTTTITSSTTPTLLGSGNSSSPSGHLSPEGRVSKPVRRRSRASRRTPTTLLNTDTTNFRAMVQQFTGGPTAPFASPGSQLNAASFNFGLNPRQGHHVNHPSAVMVPAASAAGYHHHLQYQQQNQPPYMFSLGNNSPGHGELFFQRLGNPTSDGLVMNGVSSQQQVAAPPPRPPSNSSSNENRGNSFLF